MAKPYSSRLRPCNEWVLVRKASKASEIEIPIMEGKKMIGTTKKKVETSRAIVIEVGPGEYDTNGQILRKPDPRLKPGVTIIADARHFLSFTDIPEWKEEDLWQIPASLICHIEEVAGLHVARPAVA